MSRKAKGRIFGPMSNNPEKFIYLNLLKAESY